MSKSVQPMNLSFLRESQILQLIPVSKSTFRRWINEGKFPRGIKLSPRITVWLSADVYEWISKFQTTLEY